MSAVIHLAGGCFWGMEHLYRALPGVLDVTAGYANGDSAAHADYPTVCTGATGFREAVRVVYDPDAVSLRHLLFAFFAVIDPETPNRQGMDFGTQYQTGIYWTAPADEAVILEVAALERPPLFAVELKPLENFYPAEDLHQRYLEKHPGGYCHIAPRRIAALAAFPYSTLHYDRPASVLLDRHCGGA